MLKRHNQSEREGTLRRYFEIVLKPEKTLPLVIIGAGFFAVLMSLLYFKGQAAEESSVLAFAWLFLIIGIGTSVVGFLELSKIESKYHAALNAIQPRPSDSEVDEMLADSRQRLLQHSRNILTLVGSERDFSEPLVIQVPTLNATYGAPLDDIKWQKGKDGSLRFSFYKTVIIYLTERHLAAYTCDFNFIRDVALNESTREYHYQDIISVATYEWSQSYTLPTGHKLSTAQIFRLAVASGESIEIRIDNEELRKMTKEEQVPTIGADQVVRTVRAMLRDKKTSAVAV